MFLTSQPWSIQLSIVGYNKLNIKATLKSFSFYFIKWYANHPSQYFNFRKQFPSAPPSIPSWQLDTSNQNQEKSTEREDDAGSGSSTNNSDSSLEMIREDPPKEWKYNLLRANCNIFLSDCLRYFIEETLPLKSR